MSVTHAQHMAHLDAEQAEGDAVEWQEATWHAITGLPLEPPDDPDLDETYPPDPERTAA